MLNQKVLFTKEEIYKIRNYVTDLEDRVIGTYHPNINEGKQSLPENITQYSGGEIQNKLKYGVSITDCCIGLTETTHIINKLFFG